MYKFQIAGFIFQLNAPRWVLHENLLHFETDIGMPDVICSVIFKEYADFVLVSKNADLIVKTAGTSIYNNKGTIINISGDKYDIPSCLLASNNWSECMLFLPCEYQYTNDPELIFEIKQGVLSALRQIMIAILSQNSGLLLHSCSILWGENTIAFSGQSGAGKSTHANLWKKMYDVKILDGDVTACRIINSTPIAFGLPWCGSSGEFINTCSNLRAIVFIQQAKKNSIRKLDFKESYLRLAARCFLLPWNRELTNSSLDIIHKVAASTEIFLLDCLPNYEAVELVKKCLEKS